MDQNDILKELIEHGRESGYLTYEEIHRYLPDPTGFRIDLDQVRSLITPQTKAIIFLPFVMMKATIGNIVARIRT